MLPDGFHTVRLLLRPIAREDAGAIFEAYAQDPEVARFLTWRAHRCPDDTTAFIARCVASSSRMVRTYVVREDSAIRGAIDLRLDEPHRLEIGYALARSCWGRGLMTEVLETVARWALAQPKIYRIGAVCDIENVISARVLEKAGFIREALLRRWQVHPNISDEPRDCLSYARVR